MEHHWEIFEAFFKRASCQFESWDKIFKEVSTVANTLSRFAYFQVNLKSQQVSNFIFLKTEQSNKSPI